MHPASPAVPARRPPHPGEGAAQGVTRARSRMTSAAPALGNPSVPMALCACAVRRGTRCYCALLKKLFLPVANSWVVGDASTVTSCFPSLLAVRFLVETLLLL